MVLVILNLTTMQTSARTISETYVIDGNFYVIHTKSKFYFGFEILKYINMLNRIGYVIFLA